MILVFIQIDWPLQECLVSLLSPLTDAGAQIYVFYNTKGSFIDEDRLASTRARFLPLAEKRTAGSSLFWAAGKAALLATKRLGLSVAWASIFNDYADFSVRFNSKKIERLLQESRINPDLIIGVEKKGVIVAERITRSRQAKLAYYCIELYYGNSGRHISNATLFLESRALRKANHIIIQDSDRYEYLAHHMPIQAASASLIPVSAEQAYIQKPRLECPALKPVYKLKEEGKFLFLYSGMTSHCEDLIILARKWQQYSAGRAHLILHIHGRKQTIRDLKKIAQNTADILIIEEMLTSHFHNELIRCCDTGIALYTGIHANSSLIAKSSQKVANYLMHKKPILAYKNKSFSRLFSKYRCGEAVEIDLCNLGQKLEIIIDRHEFYAKMAGEAYEAIYSAKANSCRLYEELDRLIRPRPATDTESMPQ